MSLLKANAVQLGQSLTATNNFTWYQPATPDGTVRLGNGNSGSVTDLVTLTSAGNLGIGTSSPSSFGASYTALTVTGSTAGVIQSKTTGADSRFYATSTDTLFGTWTNTPLRFLTNSTEQMRLDSSGNLGLGVTPSAWSGAGAVFQTQKAFLRGDSNTCDIGNNAYFNGTNYIYSSNGYATHYTQVINAGYHAWFNAPSGTAGNAISFTQAMTLDASGNLLVGKTTASDANIGVYNGANGYINSTLAASTNGGGNTLVVYSTGASAYRFYVGMGGTINATSTTITAISDQRLKENIRDLDDGLETILALKPRKFDWKEGQGKNIKNDRGFIAQEFEQVFPDMIESWADPAPEGEEPYKAVNANLVPTLVKAIQELSAQVSDLKTELNELKQKVNA